MGADRSELPTDFEQAKSFAVFAVATIVGLLLISLLVLGQPFVLLIWIGSLAIPVIVLYLLWRIARATERIADELEE